MKRRTEQSKSKHTHKMARYDKPKGKSKYAKKVAWLHSNLVETESARVMLWGFNVPEPKPWR